MGGSQSSKTVTVQSLSAEKSPQEIPKSGVRIVNNSIAATPSNESLEKQIQGAFEAGKEEGKTSVQKSLDLVASQVYDNMRLQLIDIQKDSLKKSEKMAEEVRGKLKTPSISKRYCEKEQQSLLVCLKDANAASSSAVSCEALANSYTICALASAQ